MTQANRRGASPKMEGRNRRANRRKAGDRDYRGAPEFEPAQRQPDSVRVAVGPRTTQKSMNIYQRHGARVKIATAADFNGNRWTNTAVDAANAARRELSDARRFHREAVQKAQRDAGVWTSSRRL